MNDWYDIYHILHEINQPGTVPIVAKTDISKIQRVVFGPTTYAAGVGGTSFELKLAVCRN